MKNNIIENKLETGNLQYPCFRKQTKNSPIFYQTNTNFKKFISFV